jgi:hypothetical protein
MRDELQRASFPRLGKRKRTAGGARNRQRLEAGRFEILVKHADRIVANDVPRSRDGIRGNRNAAGQRFELNDAERVGSAREHEYVCRCKMCGQGFPFQLTEKVGVRKAALQFARLRPLTNDDLRAGQIEREKCRQVLFYREAADTDENRAGQIDRRGALGTEETPRVHIARCAKPRLPSSSIKERAETIVTAAAA